MDEREFVERLQNPDVYHYPAIDWPTIIRDIEDKPLSNSRKVRYYEIPIAFDIETTSFYSTQLEKVACMYCWALSINGHVILGRKWSEFDDVYNKLLSIFELDDKTRLLIYIQNLAYEFQFICHHYEWSRVFALKEKKPLSCVTTENVEFRCSYMLSGFSLEKIGENLQRYKINKMVGDLDYSKPRHYNTPLTEKEWKYVINDVQVVVAYIQETAENDGGYHKIPLTKTGYVRNYCREICFNDRLYRKTMKILKLEADEYRQLKAAFAGGFTHANWTRSRFLIKNMDSFDETSAYPYTMVAEKFPMSKGRLVPILEDADFYFYIKNYCCLFDIEIMEVDGWDAPDHILSRSKCRICEGYTDEDGKEHKPVYNNGRVITAHRIVTTMTEVDFEMFKKFYKYKTFRVSEFRIYEKMYLPTPFVKAILGLYSDKTTLKDVPGKEVEYMKSKGMLNSAYGMCVTDIIRDDDTFTTKWTKNSSQVEDQIDKYNNSVNRFLFYPWGVWVTAYARRNLYTAILEFGNDYIYSDTDSVKVVNAEEHKQFFEDYNAKVAEKLKAACEYHKIPFELTRPKTIKGVEKPLGIWEHDGEYRRFKTLGAKRYMTETYNKKSKQWEINITVSGLRKDKAMEYLNAKAEEMNCSPFDLFEENLHVPGESTGKQIHTYNDNEFSDYLTDYLGETVLVHELSSIHLEPAAYHLSLVKEYVDLLNGIYEEKE